MRVVTGRRIWRSLPVRDPADQPLVEGLRRGDSAAFEAAYERYRARVFGFLLRLCRRRDVAEELLQETWLKLARSAPRLAEDTDLPAWLYTVARNAWVSHRRWTMLDLSRLVALDDEVHWRADDGQVEARVDDRRAVQRLERAIGRLPDAQREVLLLVTVEGFEPERAAEILGIKWDALRQRLGRARVRLAELLALDDAALAMQTGGLRGRS